MRPNFAVFLKIILFASLLFPACQRLKESPDNRAESQDGPISYMIDQRSFPYAKVDKQAYRNALQSLSHPTALRADPDDSFNQTWELRGPFGVGGRITDIEMPINDTNTIYAGSASGGIFLSKDQGQSFSPIFDDVGSLSIGDLDISVQNPEVIYVGTGEANAGGGSLAYDGMGIFKSTDGGANWESVGLEDAGSVGKVVISKQNDEVVYVAAMGDLFTNTGQRGVFKTSDGGDSWEQKLFLSDSSGAIDLAIHPQNDQIIYAAMWERIRRPHKRQYGGATSAVFKSTDGGDNWVELTNGLPSEPSLKGRIGIAMAPSNPEIIYLYYMDATGFLQGIYRSSDAGHSWTKTQSANIRTVSFGWWFGKIEVAPDDPNQLYATNLDMWRSDNGAASWTQIFPQAHVDHHAVFIHPQNPDFIVNGNDGGVYLSYDRGKTENKVSDLPNNQFYSCKIDPNNPANLYGGMQDNGTYRILSESASEWSPLTGGDGFGINIDPNDSNIFYTQIQRGALFRTTNNGRNFTLISLSSSAGPSNWNTPLTLDPANSSVLYTGTQRLYKSSNRGSSWQSASPILVNNNNPQGNIRFGTLTSISVSEADNNIIYVGTDDGNVWVTENGGSDWTKISRALPKRWITRVAAHPIQRNWVYLTVSGYRFGESKAQVFFSDDLGKTWQDIGKSLPDIPANDIVIDPQLKMIYVATDIGVYYKKGIGDNWLPLGQGLPTSPVTDLDIVVEERLLTAATYGRSMYSYQLPSSAIPETNEQKIGIKIFPQPADEWINLQSESAAEMSEIRLYDMSGKLLIREPLANLQQYSLAVSQYPAGSYFIQVDFKNGESLSEIVQLH